jgi:pimeloyl-ACP methyl ester carboxylesterase
MTIRRFRSDDGLTLAYDDSGGAPGLPVLVCLPGLTRNMEDFESVHARYAGRWRVLRPDYRGRGLSDRDANHRNYAVPREARDVLAMLDDAGVARAVLLGTSRGGMIAMFLAATARDRLSGVILNDIGPELDTGGLARIMDYVGRPPVWRTLDAAAAGTAEAMAAEFPGLTAADWRPHVAKWYEPDPAGGGLRLRYDPALGQAMADQARSEQARAEKAGKPGGGTDLWPLFDAMAGLPLAVIRGARSDLLTRATVAAMQARRPDMVAVEVPDRGHVPFLDEPESVAAIDAVLAAAAPAA